MYQFICYICLTRTLSTYFRSLLRLSVSGITHMSLYSSLTSTICALYRTSILFLISDISHLGICSHRCFLSLQFLKTREIHLPLAIKISLFILMVYSFVYETLGKPLNECGEWISGRGGVFLTPSTCARKRAFNCRVCCSIFLTVVSPDRLVKNPLYIK